MAQSNIIRPVTDPSHEGQAVDVTRYWLKRGLPADVLGRGQRQNVGVHVRPRPGERLGEELPVAVVEPERGGEVLALEDDVDVTCGSGSTFTMLRWARITHRAPP